MPEKYTTPYPAKRIYPDGRAENTEVLLARECPVELFLNGKRFTTLLASPAHFKELAAGHMISEGILGFEEIAEITVEGNRVEIKTFNPEVRRLESKKEAFVSSEAVFGIKAIFAGLEYLTSETYKVTRGTHLAALVDRDGKLVFQVVDVGRHNAVDKAIGYALLNRLPLTEMYLLSTGRQPEYMVMKAVRAGIPLVVTKAMPFDSGVEAAKNANMGLVGQLKKESMLAFANEWRVKV
ncbi:formate dehydrogenase accessory sulfurtransferase FdhD [Methanosarcina sp. Mfa9]|uniref:formate dehydrogenase accessory sulfurtransferase FdhD n=1 Tax=Methanosarcina sp. Mfa9 TaxID=3439063 RepID=UPI003F84FABC